MTSIKTKLIGLTSAGILFTALLLGGFAIWRLTKVSNESSSNSLQLICDKEKDRLDASLGNIQYSVDSMKDVLLSSIGDIQTFAKDSAYREKLTREFEELFYTIAYHTSSAVSYYVRYNPELITDGAKGFLWTKRSRFSSFSEMSLTDINKYDASDMEHVGWYYVPVMNGKATWMKPYQNKNLNIYMVSYVVPLFIRGKLLGVVGMDADFTIIIDEINSMNVYKNGYAYITDDKDKIIYHKDYELGADNIVKQKNTQEVSAEMNNGWNVIVTVPEKDFYAERNKMLLFSVVLVVIIATLFILITTRLTNRIINPLLELTRATERIKTGDFDVKLTTVTNDEIGVLARTFKGALHSLPEYIYKDPLTGLRNSSAYKRAVSHIETRMDNERNMRFSVLVFDVNYLKQTNENYGFEVGNQVLINASKLICGVFVHSPVFSIGDGKFVVILENSDFEARETLLKTIDDKKSTFTLMNKEFEVSLARGMSDYNASTDNSYADVFAHAEDSMRKHKEIVKNRFRIMK